ncbi:UDP-N-acetylglucosamine transferase subunit ALG14 homolog isoform X1 [Octopus bimaculoides]|uniref:UDP-N-acetylglucosamine transferase subunit ALG14 n=1 Tax=Octopus bimaculoides TaxID=37653 RepID=A0A0L8FI47_OCTBM|nr:UDP-N-acetylglucosamine transferase subunit ALG14 homolog isoform X1 [Octopus bimaculoides]|eukprot:XP_014789651.1 PREDICTED: UDP-N-acetylglucosamine transferase subunit ALG14 homolog isoform X1 [Octopus bimaculoides]
MYLTWHLIRLLYSVLATFLGLLPVWLLLCILYRVTRGFSKTNGRNKRCTPVSTLAVLGSGGHTMEMIRLLSGLTEKYYPRHYVVANSDKFSNTKIEEFEQRRSLCAGGDKAYKVYHIPRSREVGQSYFSSIFSTIYSCFCCFPLVRRIHPDLILCNGPGICVPIVFVGLILKYLFLMDVTIVYVESVCRVKTLSLSAQLLYPFIDHLLVQWPQLKERYSGADFLGRLI